MIFERYYIPYEDPNTGLAMIMDSESGVTLIKFRDMTAEISLRRMQNMMRKYLMLFTKKQLVYTSPLELVEWFREELIAQCVADWIKAK